MKFVVEIRVYTEGLCPPKDFGLESMNFFMVSSKKWGTMII